jgi:putative ABC transport system permease protein
MHGLDRELRDAFRSLTSRPAFLATAVLTLAVGIGANATVFAFVDALFLRPLPFGDRSERIVTLHSTHPTLAPNLARGTMTYGDVRGLSSRTRAFDGVAGYIGRNGVVIGRGDFVERVRGGLVTPGLFEVLGTRPLLGRTFVEEDAADPGFEQAVMISHGLWRRLFDASPDAVGQPFQMNGRSLTLIGVMPPGFRFPERDDLWLPYRPADGQQQLRNRNMLGIAALSEGTSIDQAERELGRISVNLGTDIPDIYRNWTMRVAPFRASFVGREATLLMATLLGAVLFVLAIGCANLANLLLVRGMSRQREMAIRVAMGAGRWRLAWQVLLECLIVSVAGASIGVVGATWAIDIIVAAFPEDLPHWAQVGIDWRVVALVYGVSIHATMTF